MTDIPKFQIFGENDPQISETIQPELGLRNWSELSKDEKDICHQQLLNDGWLIKNTGLISQTFDFLNHKYLRRRPGKRLHDIGPLVRVPHLSISNEKERNQAAYGDFNEILLTEESDALVLTTLSYFAMLLIDRRSHSLAKEAEDDKTRNEVVRKAFERFDLFSNCLNHIFEQFSVNMKLTRTGLIPVQDKEITERVYEPTLRFLADPKWETVSRSLNEVFAEFTDKNYPEVITKAHSTVQRFLQVLVGEEGKNAKGEVKDLLRTGKRNGLIPADQFSGPIVHVLQGFIVSERANNSTAKPAKIQASQSEVLLVMNVVMVFLQHCLTAETTAPAVDAE